MLSLLNDLLSRQDPAAPHSLLTRVIVSLAIITGYLVYYGVFGVFGAVVVYLVGVELMDMGQSWVYLTFGLALLIGLVTGLRSMLDYWRNYGHG